MKNIVYDVVIVGAGHAGLSLSYHLKLSGLEHLVLERGSIAESWRNQRWDSFRLNTRELHNKLPGEFGNSQNLQAFTTAREFADKLKVYASRYNLPVVERSKVTAISKDSDTGVFVILTREPAGERTYFAKQVVVASGAQNEKKVPPFAHSLSPHILQLHTCEYKSADKLPPGATLVVGSAQSGCQIAEDLAEGGRKVYLSTSLVARLPRRYRGKDIVDWLLSSGFFDVRTCDIKNPKVFGSAAPQLSGTNGQTLSLQSLAARGVVIIGRIATVDGAIASIEPNGAAHVRFGDECSGNLKKMIDGFISERGIEAPMAEVDIDDMPDVYADCVTNINTLNLDANNIRTVIWATGFSRDMNFLQPLWDGGQGGPGHVDGISEVDGLFFVGLPWLRTRKSGIIHGSNEDAAFIAGQVMNRWKFFKMGQSA